MRKKTATPAKKAAPKKGTEAASPLIDARIRELDDWRGQTLGRIRRIILAADPEIVEEWKWETPVWSRHGILCTGETYKDKIKLTFAKGASLEDPSGLFNASLDGNARRAIDLHEGDMIDGAALAQLIRAAVALNLATATKKGAGPVKLLSGGNPQIAKAYGDAPVQAYIAAMPGWKSEIGRRLDALIEKAVPGVKKAVKWNSPLYGIEEGVWFLGIHCFTKYIKVAFFRGASFDPLPPGTSKQKDVRYLDIYEDDPLDEAQFADWVKQAAALPGERM